MEKKRSAGRIAASVIALLMIFLWCAAAVAALVHAALYVPEPGEGGMGAAFEVAVAGAIFLFSAAGAVSTGLAALGLRALLKRSVPLRPVGIAAFAAAVLQNLWYTACFVSIFFQGAWPNSDSGFWITRGIWVLLFLAAAVLLIENKATENRGAGEK